MAKEKSPNSGTALLEKEKGIPLSLLILAKPLTLIVGQAGNQNLVEGRAAKRFESRFEIEKAGRASQRLRSHRGDFLPQAVEDRENLLEIEAAEHEIPILRFVFSEGEPLPLFGKEEGNIRRNRFSHIPGNLDSALGRRNLNLEITLFRPSEEVDAIFFQILLESKVADRPRVGKRNFDISDPEECRKRLDDPVSPRKSALRPRRVRIGAEPLSDANFPSFGTQTRRKFGVWPDSI